MNYNKELTPEQQKTIIEMQKLALVGKAVQALIDAYLELDMSIEELGKVIIAMAERKINK